MTVCTPLYISSEMDKMVMWNSFLHQNDWKHISPLTYGNRPIILRSSVLTTNIAVESSLQRYV